MKRSFLIPLLVMAFQTVSRGQDRIDEEYLPFLFADSADIQWFVDAKFGVFIHWGPSSLAEVPISWGRYGPRPGAGRQAVNGVPQAEYDSLYKVFNPVEFDAEEWVRMVRDAGAGYLIFTTKHHDGFCMFDARNTRYKITNTPFGRDVSKELADACHKYGIKLFWYYSQPDWYHPDCLGENHERYREYMYEHIGQLLTEYGKVDGLFFDHLGTRWTDWDTPRLMKMIRSLQPGILVNRRWGGGMPGVKYNGDYDNPEQEIGHFEIDRPWESCATMATAWSWTGGNKVKSDQTCLRMLIQCAGSGGNLALNTGPKPSGEIHATEYRNYIRIGKWLDQQGEAIYKTTGGPYKPGPWGVSTRKGNTIYLHILTDYTDNAEKIVTLPSPGLPVLSCSELNGKKLAFVDADNQLSIELPDMRNSSADYIIEVKVEGNSADIEPFDDSAGDITSGKRPFASSWSGENRRPEMAFLRDNNEFSEGRKLKGWWEPSKEDENPFLGFEFPEEVTFTYVTLAEQIRNATTRDFELQYEKDGRWITFYKGNEIGFDFSLTTGGITTSKVRILIHKTHENSLPNIASFKVLN